jgi:hypothetical protein
MYLLGKESKEKVLNDGRKCVIKNTEAKCDGACLWCMSMLALGG